MTEPFDHPAPTPDAPAGGGPTPAAVPPAGGPPTWTPASSPALAGGQPGAPGSQPGYGGQPSGYGPGPQPGGYPAGPQPGFAAPPPVDTGFPIQPVQPGPLVPPVRPRRGRLDLILVVAAFFAAAGVAFAAGRLTAPAAATTGLRGGTGLGGFGAERGLGGFGAERGAGGFGNGGFGGEGGTGGGGFGGGLGGRIGGTVALSGQVVEVAADHITIKLTSGQTVQVPITSSTTYHAQAAASASNVTAGSKVLIQLAPSTTAPGQSPAPGQSGTPGGGGFANFGTASDVTVVGP